MGGTVTTDVKECRVFVRVGLIWLSEEKGVVGVEEEGLEGVSDNRLISIAKVYAISADVATGCVNKIGCACVILVHGYESCAREGTLEWFIGV